MKEVAVWLIMILGSLSLNASAASAPPAPTNLHIAAPGAPNITFQPRSQTVIVGQSATFTVAAGGDAPLKYQWTLNGLNVGSGTWYTRSNCQPADDGGRVRVTVSNGSGSIQSSPQTLTVNPDVPNYFVAAGGSTSNTGVSADSPWPLSYAISHAGPSNVVTLLPGTYPSITIAASGVILRSQIKWGARVLGSPGTHGIVTGTGVSNVVVDGFEVAYSYIDAVKINGPNSTVRNCWIHHAGKGDPSAVENTDMSFTGQGIAAHNQSGTLIENNLIENCGAWKRHDHGIYLNGTNCVIRNNVIRNNLAYGIQLYDYPQECANVYVYNNLIYNNDAGLTVWADSCYTNYVYNNTIVVPSNYCIISEYGRLVAKNNILLVSAGWWPTIGPENGSVVETDYNLVSKSPVPPYPGGPHDVVASNPGFVEQANGLFWLSSSSAARGMANPSVAPPIDFFGRTQSTLSDVGAFQYSPSLAGDTRVLKLVSLNLDYWSLP